MSESLELIVSGKGCEKDIRMVERAIRQRWDVPDRLRRKCIDHCEKILDDPSVTPRNALSAFKALIQADKINWLEESGEKLAKLHGAVSWRELSESATAERVTGVLAHAAGLLDAPMETTPAELLDAFDWSRITQDDQVMRWHAGVLSHIGTGIAAG